MKTYIFLFFACSWGILCFGMKQRERKIADKEWSKQHPLFDAVYRQNIKEVQAILEQGTDVNHHERNFTALMFAAAHGYKEMVEF